MEYAEIDTHHFKGNFPESCEIHALNTEAVLDWKDTTDDSSWVLILPRTKLGPHRQHYFKLENVDRQLYSHVRVTIHPDGGIKRVRIFGRRAAEVGLSDFQDHGHSDLKPESMSIASTSFPTESTYVPVLPLTPEAFSPFGQVIQAYTDHTAPKGTHITPANGGTARKFHKLSLLRSSYPTNLAATTGLSVYRCQPVAAERDGTVRLTALERHPYTNQAFIPMSSGPGEGLGDIGKRYLVVVARNGEDDRPDLQSVRAFLASTAQGIVYNQAAWRTFYRAFPPMNY